MNDNFTPQPLNSQSPLFRPLASNIARPQTPQDDGARLPRVQRVSNLRVNRALVRRDSLEKRPLVSPTVIHGERIFKPSEELQRRLERIQQVETAGDIQEMARTQPQPLPPEKRKEELQTARASYEDQVGKLKQRETDLQQAVLNLTGKLAQTQNKLNNKEKQLQTQAKLQEKTSQQQSRIQELEEQHQSLLTEMGAARESWKQKTEELERAKQKGPEQSAEIKRQLGQQINEQQEKISTLSEKKNTLIQKIHKEAAELKRLQNAVSILSSQNKEKEELIRQQQHQLEELQDDKEKVSRFANELVKKLAQVENLQRVENKITVAKKPPEKKRFKPKIIKAVPVAKGILSLTNKVNAINGLVYNAGEKPLENALVVIKNNKGQPQRALRTNQLGEFFVASSLSNGTYRVEVEKEGINFDIIEMELTGKVLDPVEIKPVS